MKIKPNSKRTAGFATVDFLIVAVIVLIVVTYAWTAITAAQRSHTREGAAQQFASFLGALSRAVRIPPRDESFLHARGRRDKSLQVGCRFGGRLPLGLQRDDPALSETHTAREELEIEVKTLFSKFDAT